MNVPEVFALSCELATKEGAAPLNEKYEGRCWERQLGKDWWIAFNGNPSPVKCTKGNDVPPFSIYGERLGWPAIQVNPSGGTSGHPGLCDLDVEGELITLLKEAIA